MSPSTLLALALATAQRAAAERPFVMRHSNVTVEDAFERFRADTLARGLSDLTDIAHPEVFGSRVSTLTRETAALRLVWDGKDETLTLEITHGPPGGPAGWLNLYLALRSSGELVPDQRDFSFESAVEYGLDLMNPGSVSGAA